MKFILQILSFFLVWFTNTANATPVFVKLVLPSYELTFSKTENVKKQCALKIGVQNFARSGISKNLLSQKSTSKVSYALGGASRAGERGVLNGAGNVIYKSDFATHLTDVVGFTQQRGVIGGHNLSNFENYLTTNAIEINQLSTTNGSIDGLIELSYQIKKADGSGGWKATIFKKTIYDPAKISDAQVIQFGKEAMQEGITSSRTVLQAGSNTIIKGEAVNGMKFLGYQNPATGEILNFHPVINW